MTSSPVRRSRRRWLMLVVLSPLILWLMGAAFFRIVLVRDQSTAGWGDSIALINGPEIDEVVALYREMPSRRIVILQKPPARPMQLGVLPEFHVHMRGELIKRGVPAEAIRDGLKQVYWPATADVDPVAQQIVDERIWNPMPGSRLIIVADRLSSGRVRRTIRQQSIPQLVEVRVFARRLSGVSEFNWCFRPAGVAQVIRELSLRRHPDPNVASIIEISTAPVKGRETFSEESK
jgi:hypothetical protein